MTHMIIHNRIDEPRWKKIPCHCLHDGNPEHEHPMKICTHCKAEICESSIPTESFFITENVMKDGKPTNETYQREVLEIKLVNCESTQMCLGWIF